MKTRLVVISMLALAACGKKAASPGASNQADGTFQPETTGSQWTYQVSESLNPAGSLILQEAEAQLNITIPTIDTSYTTTLTATNQDTSVGGMSYTVLSADSLGIGNVYTSIQDSDYYSIGIVPAFNLQTGVTTSGGEAPVLYLKDQPAGTTWTQQAIAGGDTTVYTMTIDSTSETMVVSGTTYTNVLKETVNVVPGGLGGSGLSISANYYFARKVGLIEVSINSLLLGLQYSEILTSASIQ